MRVEIITIFPEVFEALDVSLLAKARGSGLLVVEVHDLREWTHDRHRTVDDTPFGGGAGMVMKPEPWGEALDAVETGPGGRPTLVVPTPAGRPFTQAIATELATREHLVFACGRYEGIDQRVLDEAETRFEVEELSLGDYVLNGGEIAALAMMETIARLLPGFMGNPESLAEESHTGGLLEYPVYTRPARWRGHEAPPVLLSGDHARIAAWRRSESVRRTAERRPDLAHPARALSVEGAGVGELRLATPADAGELLTLQRACWWPEQRDNPGVEVPALYESFEDVQGWLAEWTTLVLRAGDRLVGAVRGRRRADQWDIGRIMVAPDLQGHGIGRSLLVAIERAAPDQVRGFVLFTGAGSGRNIRMYRKAGYRLLGEDPALPGAVRLAKRRAGQS